jgi:hypothetical protein
MTDDDEHGPDDYPEQFSDETRQALRGAVSALTEGLQEHADQLTALRGGTSDIPAVFAVNRRIAQLLDAWNEAVFDLTGTTPVLLDGLDDDDDEDEDEDEDDLDDDTPDLVDADPLTVVERWDLVVTDADALVHGGREAHRRLWPKETDRDAQAAVPSAAQALYALLHERGEPWYDLPGVEVVAGSRAYVRPDEPVSPDEDDDDVPDDIRIQQPSGEVLYGESWR